MSVEGDPGLLDRLVTNLVLNAVRHNIPNGWVEVTTKRRPVLSGFPEIANTGPTIEEATIATSTEPFRRGRPQSRSTGEGGFAPGPLHRGGGRYRPRGRALGGPDRRAA